MISPAHAQRLIDEFEEAASFYGGYSVRHGIAFSLLLLIVLLPAAFHTITECRASGGIVVQGLYRWECIR